MDQAVISRYVVKKSGIIISTCSQIDFMSGYLDHYILGKIESIPADSFDDVKSTISFTAVLATFMPVEGTLAFTISLPLKKRRLFSLFDNRMRKFVARSHFWNAEEFEKSQRLTVQKVYDMHGSDQVSMVDCKESEKIEDLFQRYLDIEEKLPCSFFSLNSDFVMIKATREMTEAVFKKISEEVQNNLGKFTTADNFSREYSFSFSCGCNSDKINSFFSTMSQSHIDCIFEYDQEVSIECPRCGLVYKIKKNEITKN
ncbi:MAG TPA: Hsp33 family molecular chaperone HslO [bacterium]|nr:Hsp33 family molecular chaperone HslO [bacterium]HPS29957.1 Hsp33 family molecular chaperone HslO [bacterium]